MTTDNTNVVQPTEQAPVEKPVSPAAETTPKVETPAAEPLTKEAVAQMIAEAAAKAVNEAKELGKRELQSAQDRNKAELAKAERRARLAEGTLSAARTHLKNVDPDIAKEMELAELRAEREGRATVEQQEEQARQQAEFHQGFIDRQTQFITDLGLDPKDERIDWAGDAPNYLDAMERIQRSVAKIQKENVQAMQSGLEKRLKEIEAKVNKVNVEANSVETTTSQGVVAGSDAEFVKLFAEDKLPLTKANVERYQKLLEQS